LIDDLSMARQKANGLSSGDESVDTLTKYKKFSFSNNLAPIEEAEETQKIKHRKIRLSHQKKMKQGKAYNFIF